MGQAELARLLDMAVTTVFRWEHGKSSPRERELPRIAAVLNVSVGWLAGREVAAEAPHWAEFLDHYPEASRLDAQTREAMQDFAARSGMRIRGWLDWVKLADVVLQAQPSATFQEKAKARAKKRKP